MCDQDHWDDDLKNYTTGDSVSRRTFGALSVTGNQNYQRPFGPLHLIGM